MVQKEPVFGIMQGRLVPKYQNRYQAHPLGYWKEEFQIARDAGLVSIEFILDFSDAEKNPLMSSKGINEIKEISLQTGIVVNSVCADYFMDAPLHHPDEKIRNSSAEVLLILLRNGAELGLTDIVLPCVDQSSLTDDDAKNRLVQSLTPLLEMAEKTGINLSLETDLAPVPFTELLNRFDSARITVNYDTGNSASLGYDPIEEFRLYGNRISDIHIKDRKLGGGSVILGEGDTKFENFFTALSGIDYNMPFIFQVYRDDEGVAIFKQQMSYFKKIYTEFFKS